MATASAKTSEMIMAGKIFGAAEGLRPRARIAANPIAAITADGPTIVKTMTINMIKLRMIPLNYQVTSYKKQTISKFQNPNGLIIVNVWNLNIGD